MKYITIHQYTREEIIDRSEKGHQPPIFVVDTEAPLTYHVRYLWNGYDFGVVCHDLEKAFEIAREGLKK